MWIICQLWRRLRRNRTPLRLQEKASKRDLEASENRLRNGENSETIKNSEYPFGLVKEGYLKLDNTNLSVEEYALKIIETFKLMET